MSEKEKTRRVQTVIVSACVILAVLLLFGLVSNIVTLVSKYNRIAKVEAQIAELDRKILELDNEIEYRKTNEYVEKYAREHLEMTKTDEIAFIGK